MNPENNTCVHKSYTDLITATENYYNSIDHSKPERVRIWTHLFDWTRVKFEKFATERNLVIPWQYMPKRIDSYKHSKLSENSKLIVSTHYTELDDNGKKIFKINPTASNATQNEIQTIVQELVFKRANVIWVDFGCNIGNEFGGVHPAVILKKAGDNLIVLPLSSGPSPSKADYIVPVPLVYQMKKKQERWTSVHRIRTIHPKRIVYSDHGCIPSDTMKLINEAIKKEYCRSE